LVTLSTALTLLAFGLLANYIRTARRLYLGLAAGVCFLVAFIHVTEIFAIGLAGAVALLLWRKEQLTLALRDVAILGFASVLGVLPHLLLALNHPWLRELGVGARWEMIQTPWEVLISIGVPGAVALVLLIRNISMPRPTDRLLQVWFVAVVAGACLPIMPTPQHLFDGVHYGTALLVARQLSQYNLGSWTGRPKHLLAGAFTCLLILSIFSFGAYLRQGFEDGARAKPEKLFSTVASKEELDVIKWMTTNAQSSDLVLAPSTNAPWLMTVPMHSFAGHWLWSFDYEHQLGVSEDFYAGRFAVDEGSLMLAGYGVKYVVVPDDSPAQKYLEGYEPRAKFGRLTIYESGAAKMKNFSERRNDL
jgi:hypothetical protein